MGWLYRSLPELSDEQYSRWQELLEQRTGIDFSHHKSILQAGLAARMREIDCDDYEDYYQQVIDLPSAAGEWIALVDRIAVNETSFYRQPEAYELVRRYLNERIPALCERGDTLDIWSVGCATGEEPYSLAMIVSDVIDKLDVDMFWGLVAMDICVRALAVAKQGGYLARRLESVPEHLREKYFIARDGGALEVVPELKQRICFAQGNLADLEQAPVVPMDLIFCQNVLVYFRRWRVKQVLDALVERLKPGGMLIVGPGEAAHWHNPAVARISYANVQAYRRREH